MTAKTYKQPKCLLICEGIFVDYIDWNATQAWKVYKESWNAGHEKQKNRKTRGEAEREDVIREAPELQKEAAERLGGQHVQTEQDGARGSGAVTPAPGFLSAASGLESGTFYSNVY